MVVSGRTGRVNAEDANEYAALQYGLTSPRPIASFVYPRVPVGSVQTSHSYFGASNGRPSEGWSSIDAPLKVTRGGRGSGAWNASCERWTYGVELTNRSGASWRCPTHGTARWCLRFHTSPGTGGASSVWQRTTFPYAVGSPPSVATITGHRAISRNSSRALHGP